MKIEAVDKKSLWLWLGMGIAMVLAVVGIVLTLVLGLQFGQNKNSRPDLYWNVDRAAYMDLETGISSREPAEDGNYYIRFAHDGEQFEIPVTDRKLVNYIDAQDIMGLTLDKKGFIVDIQPVVDIATVVGVSLYIKDIGDGVITANSSAMMDGKEVVVNVTDAVAIYNVSGKGEFVGEKIDISALSPMDVISVYGTFVAGDSDEQPVVTHIFAQKKPIESPVYWRAEQCYDAAAKETTREPDANGVYTIRFYRNGETVDLKCKNKKLVSEIDRLGTHWCHFGLEFDEEGYIIDTLDSDLASRTLLQCQRFDIKKLSEDGTYTAVNLINGDGTFVQGIVGADCPIYDVSKAAQSEGQANRRVDSLEMGDRVCIWTDTAGSPVLIYVTNRLVESPAYWNVTRMYDDTTRSTTRKPNENGYYEVELLKAGDTQTEIYYIKDAAVMTKLDSSGDRCVGLKVGEGNIVEYVYDVESIFGHTYFCRGYYVSEITASGIKFQSDVDSGNSITGVLTENCRIWNVSSVGTFGEATNLKVGDSVYAVTLPNGEIINAYVTRRYLGEDTMYWRLSAQEYDAKGQVTTRVPDAEGYYVYEMANKGQVVTLKTKDKGIASFIDSYSAPALSLIVDNGIIQEAHDGLSATGGLKYSGWYVKNIGETTITIETGTGSEETVNLAQNLQVYNVSNSFDSFRGEASQLKVGDNVHVFFNLKTEVAIVYIVSRETSLLAWPVAPQYDPETGSTTRVPDANGWYSIDLMVDGGLHTFKCNNKDVVSGIDSYLTPMGIDVSGNEILCYSPYNYVKNIKSTGLINHTVSAVSGNTITATCTLGASDKVGTNQQFALTANTKVYDVSPDARKRGAAVTLKEGDTIYTYIGDDDSVAYVYVVAHCTRKGGYMSLCDHCGKVVYWNAYHASSNTVEYNCHYYLASDITITNQLQVYNNSGMIEAVFDLHGNTLRRQGGRAVSVSSGDVLTIVDTVGGGKIETSGKSDTGAVIMVSGGTLNLYGGTLKHISGNSSTQRTHTGGLVYCNENGTINMYGGTLADGVVYADGNHEAHGGALCLSSATFNMYDGLITGSKAYAKASSGTGGAFGGNIFAEKNSKVNIYGGTIAKGYAEGSGGNIYAAIGVEINISDGIIIDGVTTDSGGNIFAYDTNINISGGEVVGGTTEGQYGGNIVIQGTDSCLKISEAAKIALGAAKSTDPLGTNIFVLSSNLDMTGGTIVGDAAIPGPSITLSESGRKGSIFTIADGSISGGAEALSASSALTKINISGGTLMGQVSLEAAAEINITGRPIIENIKLSNGVLLGVNRLKAGASIGVDAIGTFTKPNAADYKDYFVSTNKEMVISATTDGALMASVSNSKVAYCKHCNRNVEWTIWDDTAADSGHFFLQEDVTLSDAVVIESEKDFVLDLNGRKITAAKDKRAFYIDKNAKLTIHDIGTGGEITGGRTVGEGDVFGGNIYNGGIFTLYGGTILNGEVEGTLADAKVCGGNIFGAPGSETYIYGGVVQGGKVIHNTDSGQNTENGELSGGGNIFTAGTVVIDGATVTGGTIQCNDTDGICSHRGNNIYADDTTAIVNLSGGAMIADGSDEAWENSDSLMIANGSTLNISGDVEVTGNICINGGTCNMYGGVVGQIGLYGANDVFNLYGGTLEFIESCDESSAVANIYNGYVKRVDENFAVTPAACTTESTTVPGLYTHASGACGGCGHTYSAEGANTACDTCGKVHQSESSPNP